jgi:hypothetical protein
MHITNEFKFQHIQKAQDFQRERPKFRRRKKKHGTYVNTKRCTITKDYKLP